MKQLLLVFVVLFLAGCPAEYEVPKGHAVTPGAAGVGHSTMQGGGTKDKQDATSQDTALEDIGEEVGTEVTGDTAYADSPEIAACLAEQEYHTEEYCTCLQDEASVHPGTTYWCDCHHLVCIDEPDPGHYTTMFDICQATYPTDCEGFAR